MASHKAAACTTVQPALASDWPSRIELAEGLTQIGIHSSHPSSPSHNCPPVKLRARTVSEVEGGMSRSADTFTGNWEWI